MAKEVTLEELMTSTKNPIPVERVEETSKRENEKTTNDVVKSSNIKSARPISTSDLGKNLEAQHPEAQKKVVEEDAPLVKNAFDSMNNTLAERKRRIEEEVMPIVMENAREMAMEKEFGNLNENTENKPSSIDTDSFEDDFKDLNENDNIKASDSNDEGVYVAPTKIPEVSTDTDERQIKEYNKIIEMPKEKDDYNNSNFDDMMKDLGFDEEEEDVINAEEETTEEMRERFKASFEEVKITRNPIDLTKFQIAKEPISSMAALNAISGVSHKKRCDHPLLHSGRNMTFEECSGPELDALRKTINNSNGLNGVIASLRFVYNHNIDANKKSFESWCKSIRTEDVESLYFGMYKACYGDTNLLARFDSEEKGCKKTCLIDTPITDMIKFKDDEAHKLYDNLMNQDTTNPGNKIKSQTMVVSDDIVISYSDPTLYSTFIQYSSLESGIAERYADQLDTMAYIDGFFRIDYNNNQLIPIAIKEYPNNINKTVKSKLKTYIDILKTLSNDQYNVMVGKLNNIVGESKISYIYPEAICPECGNTISEEYIESMLNVLFTRAQLVQVKSL